MTSTESPQEARPEAAEDGLQQGLRTARAATFRAAEDLRAAAEQKAKDWARAADATADDLRERAETALRHTQVRLKSLHEESEAYVREHPLKAVLTALGAGFLVGILVRR